MSKKCYRFFGGLLNTQEKWLNKMSEKGYRLVRTGKLLYEFEKCKPDEVTYCVEFIGEKSKESSIDYANFLEDMGYKVFFIYINLNYSVVKVRWRPWDGAGKTGRSPPRTGGSGLPHAPRRRRPPPGLQPDQACGAHVVH